MKNYPTTVSIGIPVYNEELNIKRLISNLLIQHCQNFQIIEVLIMSDGSTDNTVKEIKSIHDSRIRLIIKKERLGQAVRQNEIISIFKGDILVLVEGDLLPADKFTLQKLLNPLLKSSRETVAASFGAYKEAIPSNYYQKIINHGNAIKRAIFSNFNSGKNIYILGGHSIKAFPKLIAKKINWPSDVPEDAYIYLELKRMGYNCRMNSECLMIGGEAGDLSDSLKQKQKYIRGINSLYKYFDKSYVLSEYHIPLKLKFHVLCKYLLDKPHLTLIYLLIAVLLKGLISKTGTLNPKYAIYKSSKKLNISYV